MNIKSLTQPLSALDPRLRVDGRGNVRLKDSGERDADGRRQDPGQEQRRHLNAAEFEECLKVLKENPAIAANQLEVRVEVVQDRRVILVVDSQGQIVRRLSEADLWLVTREKDRTTGRLIDKAG